jgi:hypothetical protein
MLIAGELAVRKVSRLEATASISSAKFNFKLTSRTQVSCARQCFACVSVLMSLRSALAITHRRQYAEHRGFRAEPPGQAWSPTSKSGSGVDTVWCVQPSSPRSLFRL